MIDGIVQSVADPSRETAFRVIDRGRGRIALQTASGRYVSVGTAHKTARVSVTAHAPGDGGRVTYFFGAHFSNE